jgi:thiol-disulfide isomerase/thioredoxin
MASSRAADGRRRDRPSAPVALAALVTGLTLLVAGCGGTTATARAVHRPLQPLHGGATTTLAGYAGTPLVVNFWASWCTPCLAEMPRLQAAQAREGTHVRVVGLTSDRNTARLESVARRVGATYPLLRDDRGLVQEDLGALELPTTFFFDAKGHLVSHHTGALSDAQLAAGVAAITRGTS